jgi:dTDP-4-amino-4,6-dideoxygalactose transaminase
VRIPAVDLEAQYLSIQAEVDAAVAQVLASGQYILGPETEGFERDFAGFCGAAQAVAVASGTDALQLALRACGIQPGDEVITVAHTAAATVAAVELAGVRPLLVDIDPRRYTLDPACLAAVLTARTRAIMPVHLYGCPADLEPIMDFAHRHGLLVIEDCCQAHGAVYHGRPVGTWGQAAAFSFYPTKNLGGFGDSGAVVSNDVAVSERARALRQYGWVERNRSDLKGLNSRMDELQAAVLRVKLPHLQAWNERRRALAAQYSSLLEDCGVILPFEPQDTRHVYHQYVLRHPQRDALRNHLASQGIGTLIHYPLPVHLQPAYADLKLRSGSLLESEVAAREVLSLPIRPEMSEEDVAQVCAAVRDFGA